ncbi:uncharacterized protein BDCG_02402 [Blastomyces dermatitidis ER-3]|nr:uncharacterized protein BDCG_02402 [Blastomyces dermatitidis ER-3]EEQ87282.2 hypothetical protein BDCG_02402 [Blastomyces dermatitidis ER-3]
MALAGLVIVGYHGYHGVSSLPWVIIWAFNSPGIMVIGIMVIGISIVLVLILAVMVMVMSVTSLTPQVMVISMISLISWGYGFVMVMVIPAISLTPQVYGYEYGYGLVKSDLRIHGIFDIGIVEGVKLV